jgi:hypothetical protein
MMVIEDMVLNFGKKKQPPKIKYTKYDFLFTEKLKKYKSNSFSKDDEQGILSDDSGLSVSELILRKLSISSDSTL